MRGEWTYIPFEDVCDSMLKGPFGSDIKKSLFVPKAKDTFKVYIQANAIEKDATIGEYYISKEYFETKMSRFEVNPDDYIITCDGTLGRYLRLPKGIERGIISASLLRVTLNKRIVPKFFEYLWDGFIMGHLTSDIRNSALVHLPSASKIGKVLVPLPRLEEQQRIVTELDLLSGIIDKQKKVLKELDTLAQSIFYDMFGDPVENEKGWNVKRLGEVCLIERGGSPRPIDDYLTEDEDGVNWIKIGDATDGGMVITSTKQRIRPEGVKKSRFVHKGDFLLSNSMSFGKPYILGVDGCIHDGWLVIQDTHHTFNKVYLYYFLGSPQTYESFKSMAVGGVVNNLNKDIVKKVCVAIPDAAIQESFAEKIESIEKQKASINESIVQTQKLFDYTMDKYFG